MRSHRRCGLEFECLSVCRSSCKMERERRDEGDQRRFLNHQVFDRLSPERVQSKSPFSSSPGTPPSPSGCGVGGVSYIEHRVSKMDTLAGVAIKYGVEVADIKRMNGLVTDLQMFALQSLHIPLPGRHPPSPCLSNGLDNQGLSSSEQTPPHCRHSDLFETLQSLSLKSSPPTTVSPAMSNLQGYYGLKKPDKKPKSEGFEMSVYQNGSSHSLDGGLFPEPSPLTNPPLSHHRKSKSVANGFFSSNTEGDDEVGTESRAVDSDKWYEKLIRRRQKSEADFTSHTPETLLKGGDSRSGGGFSSIRGKGLALRPKAARSTSGVDTEPGLTTPSSLGDSFVADSLNIVRKSSSTSSLQDQENGPSSSSTSIWTPPKWNLKSDLQALSTAAIARPIFDGLPKPITGRRNKAALD